MASTLSPSLKAGTLEATTVPATSMPPFKGKVAQDLALAGAGQRVLVVHRRPFGLDQHLARREGIGIHGFDAGAVTGVVLVNTERAEMTSCAVSLAGSDQSMLSTEVPVIHFGV